MISPSVLSRVIALVRHVVAPGRADRVGRDALLDEQLDIGGIDRQRLASAVEAEYGVSFPRAVIEGWWTVGDIARSVERYA